MSVEEFKRGVRATWAKGDYGATGAVELWPVGERIVARVGVNEGDDVLDVACGTGNAAIRAALAGGRVTGSDLTPELFEAARRNAAGAGVEIEWVEADVEALPFADGSFDVVLSTFGCMFAPRHELAARELARVLRPGGRLGICSWTPEGKIGKFFQELGQNGPPPPDFVKPPTLWGVEDHVRGLFAGTGVAVDFERESVEPQMQFDSPEEGLELFTTKFGPMMNLRAAAEAEGTWDEIRPTLLGFYEDDDPAEYLVTLGRKSA